jgi:hypothetical protein
MSHFKNRFDPTRNVQIVEESVAPNFTREPLKNRAFSLNLKTSHSIKKTFSGQICQDM